MFGVDKTDPTADSQCDTTADIHVQDILDDDDDDYIPNIPLDEEFDKFEDECQEDKIQDSDQELSRK